MYHLYCNVFTKTAMEFFQMAHGDMSQALPQMVVLLTSHSSYSQTFNTIWKSMMSPCLIKGTLDGSSLAALHSKTHEHQGDNLAEHSLKISSITTANDNVIRYNSHETSFWNYTYCYLFIFEQSTDQWWKDSLVQ